MTALAASSILLPDSGKSVLACLLKNLLDEEILKEDTFFLSGRNI
jgi:hypothetical protein